jgi:hypothetical protein
MRRFAVAVIVLVEVVLTGLLLDMGLDEGNCRDSWLCSDTAFYAVLAAWWVVPSLAFIYAQANKSR